MNIVKSSIELACSVKYRQIVICVVFVYLAYAANK